VITKYLSIIENKLKLRLDSRFRGNDRAFFESFETLSKGEGNNHTASESVG